jgi:hypothetical protein
MVHHMPASRGRGIENAVNLNSLHRETLPQKQESKYKTDAQRPVCNFRYSVRLFFSHHHNFGDLQCVIQEGCHCPDRDAKTQAVSVKVTRQL